MYTSNTQVDNAKVIDIVMPMYNLIEYSDNYSKTSESLWQYCKDIPAVNNDGNIVGFNGANATDSFNLNLGGLFRGFFWGERVKLPPSPFLSKTC